MSAATQEPRNQPLESLHALKLGLLNYISPGSQCLRVFHQGQNSMITGIFFYWEVFKHHFCTHELLYAALLKIENSVTIEQYFLSNMFWHIQSKYKAAT